MTGTPRRHVPMLKRAGLFAAVWLALVGADPEGVALGLAVVPAAVWLSLRLLPPVRAVPVWGVAALLPRFLVRSFSGGVDVAWRAFHPRLPIRPGWVLHPVDLPDGGRVALGAELSLMPGTLVAGAHDGRILLHVLDTGGDFEGAVRVEEARLARVLGHHPGRGRTGP